MKIACVLGPGFEDSEFQDPYNAFKEAGHQVEIVSVEAGKELKGDKGRVTATSEKAYAEVSPDQYGALFIPGGASPDKLRANDGMVAFVKAFMTAGKPTFAICHGAQLLLAADEYKNHRMTAWKTIQADLQKAGGNVVDEEVVVDRNLVTSRMPNDLPAFIRESLKVMEGVPAGT